MSSGQIARIILGISIVAVIAFIYTPHLLFTYSSSAVISGHVFTLTTPIKGRLKTELPEMGAELDAGERIAVVEDETVDRAQVEKFETEFISLKQRYTALQSERAKLTHLKELLSRSVQKYKGSVLTRLEIDIDRAKERHNEVDATLKETLYEMERRKKLLEKGFVSEAAYEASFYAHQRAIKSENQARLEVVRLVAEKESAEKGVFILFDGRKEFPYEEQRRHEIDLRLGAIETAITEARGHMDVIKKNLEMEMDRFNKQKRFEIQAPKHASIWRRIPTAGSHIDAFSPVVQMVDCTSIYVEVAVHERFFDRIKVGDVVKIRLAGSKKNISGRVMALRGGSIPKDSTAIAAVKRIRPHQEIEVFIRIDESEISKEKGDFCHVGRNAEVIFKNRFASLF